MRLGLLKKDPLSPQKISQNDHQELQFLYDDRDTFDDGQKRRERKRKNAIRSFLMSAQDLADNGDDEKDKKKDNEEDFPFGLNKNDSV